MKSKVKKYMLLSLYTAVLALVSTAFVSAGYSHTPVFKGEICIMDYLAGCESSGFEGMMLFPLLLIAMYFLNREMRLSVITRYVKVKKYWANILGKIAAVTMCISVVTTAIILILTFFITGFIVHNNKLCNWSEDNSKYAYQTGSVLDSNPALGEVVLIIFVEIFSITFILLVVIHFAEWILRNKMFAFLIGVCFVVFEKYTGYTHILFSVITLMPGYAMMEYGVSLLRCVVYPLALCILVSGISWLLVMRRDILKERF